MKHPKKVHKVIQLVDPDDEYDHDANEVHQHRNPPTAFQAKTTSTPTVAGRGVTNEYDAGSNVLIGPHVPPMLQEAAITPVHERVQVADTPSRTFLESPPLEEPSFV